MLLKLNFITTAVRNYFSINEFNTAHAELLVILIYSCYLHSFYYVVLLSENVHY